MGTNNVLSTGRDHYESKVVVAFNGIAQSDILESVGDGRLVELLDVTFTNVAALTVAGTSTVSVGIQAGTYLTTPSRRCTLRLGAGTSSADKASGVKKRLSVSGAADTGSNLGCVYTTTATGGGATNWMSSPATITDAPRGARCSSPSVITYDYTPTVGDVGAIEVRVLWKYVDTGRDLYV